MRWLTEYDDIFYKESHKKRARWVALASKITVVVYLCDGSNKYVPTEMIASHAAKTYPDSFVTMIDGRKVSDPRALKYHLRPKNEFKRH